MPCTFFATVVAEVETRMISLVGRAVDVMGFGFNLVVISVALAIESTRVVITAVTTYINLEDAGCIEVVELGVVVDLIYSESPMSAIGIDRTIEVLKLEETIVLHSVQDETHIVITPVKERIVHVDGRQITPAHIVHDGIDGEKEVIVDLVAIVVLLRSHIELPCHTIAEEASSLTHLAMRHCKHLAHGQQGDCEGYKHLFHTRYVLVVSNDFSFILDFWTK